MGSSIQDENIKGAISVNMLVIIILLVLAGLLIAIGASRVEAFGGGAFSTLMQYIGGMLGS